MDYKAEVESMNNRNDISPISFSGLKRLHFVGIGGCGMSALARIFAQRGFDVTGSDPGENKWTRTLEEMGVRIFKTHAAGNVAGADAVIISSAIRADNPERRAAAELGLPILHRSDALAEIVHSGRAIAISGTHGKTTTSAWLAYVLERIGEDPTFIVGGHVPQLGTNGQSGRGRYVVAESDESDGTFLRYRPHSAIVTNIEAEHMDHFGDFETLLNSVEQFCFQVDPKGHLILCADDPGLQRVIKRLRRQVVLYSLKDSSATFHAARLEPSAQGTSFDLFISGRMAGRFTISRPGTHNVSNALAVLAWCHAEGLDLDAVKSALAEFGGAGRRFEVKGEWNGAVIVDDYAHHPTEVLATLEAARTKVAGTGGRVVAVFQPHRFTRLADHHAGFAAALCGADAIAVMDVYAAGETPLPGINSDLVLAGLRSRGCSGAARCAAAQDAAAWLEQTLQPGDWALTLGAGDVWKAGDLLLQSAHSAPAGVR